MTNCKWKTWAILKSHVPPVLVPIEYSRTKSKANFALILVVNDFNDGSIIGEIDGEIGNEQRFTLTIPLDDVPANDLSLDEWLGIVKKSLRNLMPDNWKDFYILFIKNENQLEMTEL